jgi:glycogen debranching enzyme
MSDQQEKVEQQGAQVDIEQGAIQVLDGSTFMISDQFGDIHEGSAAGLYHEDTRHLSRWILTLDGARPVVLTSNEVDYYSASFFLTNPDLDGLPAKSVTVQRHRFVGDGMRETIRVRNHVREPVRGVLRLSAGADFGDLFEVKGKDFRKTGKTTRTHSPDGQLMFRYRHEAFEAATAVRSSQPARVEGDDLVWDLDVPALGVWETGVVVGVHVDEEVLEPTHETFGDPEREATTILRKWQ